MEGFNTILWYTFFPKRQKCYRNAIEGVIYMGKKERVILIKGDESKWYEQAIFIVNQNTPKEDMPVDFVSEAEKIIHNHVKKKYGVYKGNSVGIAYAPTPANAPANAAKASPKASPKRAAKKPAKAKGKRFD